MPGNGTAAVYACSVGGDEVCLAALSVAGRWKAMTSRRALRLGAARAIAARDLWSRISTMNLARTCIGRNRIPRHQNATVSNYAF